MLKLVKRLTPSTGKLQEERREKEARDKVTKRRRGKRECKPWRAKGPLAKEQRKEGSIWIFVPYRGVVPLRHLRHVPPASDSIATVVTSCHNQVNSITLCITLNAQTGKIVFVTLCIHTETRYTALHL